jgi:hypothetical protein
MYSTENIAHFHSELQKLRNQTAGIRILLGELAQHLRRPRAQMFTNEGVGRRLPLVARCAQNIFRLYPPNTKELLTSADCDDIAIHLHAFAINVYAIFDNIAWICMLEAGGSLPSRKVSLFKEDCERFLPSDLKTYLDRDITKTWFNKYGKIYRDSTAHRIATYLPSRAYTTSEGQQFNELHCRSNQALLDAAKAMSVDSRRGHEFLDLHRELAIQKEAIGSNSLVIALSLSGDTETTTPPVVLHPQILCDWSLANEIVRTFDLAMRKHYDWPIREIPSVHLG